MERSPTHYALRGCFIDAMARVDQTMMVARLFAKRIEPDEIDEYTVRWARIVFVERVDKWLPGFVDAVRLDLGVESTPFDALGSELIALSEARTKLSHSVWNPTQDDLHGASSLTASLEGTRHDRREIDVHDVSENRLTAWCMRAAAANGQMALLAQALFAAGPDEWRARHRLGDRRL